jgi:hypothetical protein
MGKKYALVSISTSGKVEIFVQKDIVTLKRGRHTVSFAPKKLTFKAVIVHPQNPHSDNCQ